MSNDIKPVPPAIPEQLREVARMLRESPSVEEPSRDRLAGLVEELSHALESAPLPPEEVTRLTEATTRLAESLHHRHDRGLLGQARDRLEQAVLAAEARAPLAAGLARRLVDALSHIGI